MDILSPKSTEVVGGQKSEAVDHYYATANNIGDFERQNSADFSNTVDQIMQRNGMHNGVVMAQTITDVRSHFGKNGFDREESTSSLDR